MPVITSTRRAVIQHDGTIQVRESHTDHTGLVHDVHWTAPTGTDDAELDLTMQLRAGYIGEEVDRRERAEAEARNFEIPLTRKGFLDRFVANEYATIKAAAAAAPTLDFYWQKLMTAQAVYLSDPETVAGVMMLEQAGLIAPGRAAEVLRG